MAKINIEVLSIDYEDLAFPVDKNFRTKLKFGDILINGYASERNPHRIGVVVKVDKGIHLTDMNGGFWELVLDKETKAQILGTILNEKFLLK